MIFIAQEILCSRIDILPILSIMSMLKKNKCWKLILKILHFLTKLIKKILVYKEHSFYQILWKIKYVITETMKKNSLYK